MKRKRQTEILKIINEKAIGTHDQLIDELNARGIKVTQATVSRDINELRLVKVPSESGSVYAVSGDSPAQVGMFTNSVIHVNVAMHTVVIRTSPGMAGGVAASIDDELGDMILGSIAGDDTILAIARTETEAYEFAEEIKKLFNCKGE